MIDETNPNFSTQPTLVIQPEPVQTNIPQPQPALKKNKGLNILIILVGVLFIMGVTGFGVWVYMSKITVETQDKITETKPEATTLPEIKEEESKTDETAGWKTYENRAFSLKYPSTWIVENDGDAPAIQVSGKVWKDISSTINIYNPSSMQDFCGNGGCNGTKIPSEKIVIGIILSNKTAKEIVDSECSTAELKALHLCQTFLNERKTRDINGLSAEQYPDTGEGSTGNNIVVSSGNTLGVIHTIDTNNVKMIDQILSTFKFTDTKQADETAGWKTYENKELGFSFKYDSVDVPVENKYSSMIGVGTNYQDRGFEIFIEDFSDPADKNNKGKTLEEYVKSFTLGSKAITKQVTTANNISGIIAEFPGYRGEFDADNAHLEFYFINSKNVLFRTRLYSTGMDILETDRELFNTIINNISLN